MAESLYRRMLTTHIHRNVRAGMEAVRKEKGIPLSHQIQQALVEYLKNHHGLTVEVPKKDARFRRSE